jgi:hypothetical protein
MAYKTLSWLQGLVEAVEVRKDNKFNISASPIDNAIVNYFFTRRRTH